MNAHLNYSFDDYRLDPAKRELWLGDELVPLQPKAFDCLVYLIQNRDRAVGKDELISAVWGDVDATDRVVSLAVSRARQAIGDTGDEHHIIRTITRVGYCWVMPVDEVEIAPPGNGHANGHPAELETTQTPAGIPQTDPLASADHEPRSSRRPLGPVLVAGGLALLVALIIAALTVQQDTASVTSPIEGEMAVVLPVTVIGEERAAWIRLGVMDLIAERLREAGQAVVPSDNTIALTRNLVGDDSTRDNGRLESGAYRALAETAAANLVIDARAEAVGDRWRVSLGTVHGREPVIVAQGDAPDLLAAASAASDRMAVMLGFELAAVDVAASEGSRVDYVLQQVRAAILSDRFEVAEKLLASLDEADRQNVQVRYELANLNFQRGENAASVAGFTRLLDDLPGVGEEVFRGKTLYALGFAYMRNGDYEQADRCYQEALEVLRGQVSYEARLLTGQVRMSMAILQSFRNQLAEAEASYALARIELEISGDRLALAKLDGNMSQLYSRMGRVEAISYGERAAQRFGQFGDVQNELRARATLAIAHHGRGNILAAKDQVQYFEHLLTQINNPQLASGVLIIKLGVLLSAGSLQEAEQVLKQLREQEPGAEAYTGRIQYYDAGYAHAVRDYERSSASAAAAVRHDWEPALYGENAHAWLLLLRAQIALGQARKAAQVLQDASDWSSANTGDRVEVNAILALMRGEYAAFTGDSGAAVLNFEEALNLADQTRSASRLVWAVRPYTEWLIAQGDLERAGIVAGRISALADRSYDAALVQLRLYHAMGEPSGWRPALERARALAGEREIPPELLIPPTRQRAVAAETTSP